MEHIEAEASSIEDALASIAARLDDLASTCSDVGEEALADYAEEAAEKVRAAMESVWEVRSEL